MADGHRIFRIGTGAGFAADRLDAAIDLAERGELDVIVLECLGERTVAFAHRDRLANPRRGYNLLLDRRMRALLPICRASGTTIITNMGAANPRAAAGRTHEIARELGLSGLKIACIEGDDVSGRLDADHAFMDEPGTIAAIQHKIVGMNAYLGADAIIPALNAGANVVIGGRLADPSMYLAPLMRHFGWKSTDLAALSAGTLVGHLMECGMQITGGYFADPGLKDVPDLARCGYPIAEVSADGSAVITKLAGTGGCVTESTVKEQLLYEVHDPTQYLTPDITADFSRVEIKNQGKDRVHVSNAAGRPRPERLKVTIGFDAGVLAEAGVSYAGPSAGARGRLAAEIIESRLKNTHRLKSDIRIDLIGDNSLFATAGKTNPATEDVRLHVATRTPNREEAELLLWEVEALLCCGPAGGGGFRGFITPAIMTKSALIDRAIVHPTFEMFEA